MTRLTDSIRQKPDLWAFGIIIATFILRVWFVATNQLLLVQDEAQYWDWTRNLQLTYYSKGPLIAWAIKFWTLLFGNTELGVRFNSIFGLALSQSVIYLGLSRLWKKPIVAVWAVFIFTTMPLFMSLGILATTDNPFVLCWAICIFALHEAAIPNTSRPGIRPASTLPFVVIAAFFGIGILAKYTMLGFFGLSIIYSFLLWRRDLLPEGYKRRLLIALGCGLIIGFLPTFIWNLQNDFVGYKHVFYLIGVKGKAATQFIRFDRFPDYFGSQIGLATPWWTFFMIIGGIAAVMSYFNSRISLVEDEDRMDTRQATLLAVFFWPVWGFFMLWSFHAKVLPNWATVSYVAGSILAAFSFNKFMTASPKIKTKNAILGLTATIFILAFILPQLPLPAKVNITNRLKGWDVLGEKVDELRKTKFNDPQKVFVFSDLYDITAATAFYVPGQERTYCAWIDDRRMNQYDMWPGPDAKKGWNAIMVRKHKYDEPHKEVLKMFQKVSGPIVLQAKSNGQVARTFTLYLCYGYKGYWPRREGSF